MTVKELVEKQRRFFETGVTFPVRYRKDALKKLKRAILDFEPEIKAALAADLGKSASEAYMTEIGMTLAELSWIIKHVGKMARKKRVSTPLAQFPATTYKLPCPYGVVLVISPWNYPFMLSVEPVVDALAAGNAVVLKTPSDAPETAKALKKMFAACLPETLVGVIDGGPESRKEIAETRFDYIFFTGGQKAGREIAKNAAAFLTPVSLELGGKSPCIVDKTANIDIAARRIVFGKYLNVGQTCVAPDYVLAHKEIKEKLLTALKREIVRQYGENPLDNKDYGRIVNQRHFARVKNLLKGADVFVGGQSDDKTLRIAPTVLNNVSPDDPCMQEEIFGPILPVLTFSTDKEAMDLIARHATPLALYVFTSDGKMRDALINKVSFGGGCVNDTIIHLATSEAGFGGVGTSGMGAYHGQTGFDTFTHYKTVVDKKTWLDLPMRYQPYKAFKDTLIRLFVR